MTGIWNIGNFELLLLYLRQMLGLNSALVIDTSGLLETGYSEIAGVILDKTGIELTDRLPGTGQWLIIPMHNYAASKVCAEFNKRLTHMFVYSDGQWTDENW